MNWRRPFAREIGRETRAWPMLALLLVMVLAGIGSVLWFMREAMRNERLAVREKLAEAYRSQLTLVQGRAADRWAAWLTKADAEKPDAAHFERIVRSGMVDSLICLNPEGKPAYPALSQASSSADDAEVARLANELRDIIRQGNAEHAVTFVLDRLGTSNARHRDGRVLAASGELAALELLAGRDSPHDVVLRERLLERLNDYGADSMPAGQRRFIMHEIEKLMPAHRFPTLQAEDLAARYLELEAPLATTASLRSTKLSDVWAVAVPGNRVILLLTTERLRGVLRDICADDALSRGLGIAIALPGEDLGPPQPIVSGPLGAPFPGFRVSIGASALSDVAALDRKTSRYLLVGISATIGMTLIAAFAARSFGRQVRLARLKNDLVATVSHELKTPLTAMRALVETLLDRPVLEEQPTREYLGLIASENRRLSRLIDNFLTFSRLDRGRYAFDFQRVRPADVVEDALAALGDRLHAPHIVVETAVDDALPEIEGDRDSLVIALLNLIDNALKYSGTEKRIRVHVTQSESAIAFSVGDNGVGLSPAEQARVFERFYQVDRELSRTAGGCGLGLSIVHSIAQAHGGSIEIASQPGVGSTFTLLIPTAIERPV